MQNFRRSIIIFLLFLGTQTWVFGWGAWAHYRINHAAIFSLPDSMRIFFYNHMDFITEQAVMPDTRIYAMRSDRDEAHRHYIDVEQFPDPLAAMPHDYAVAIKKYPDSLLRKTGILPWYIMEVFTKLTKSFKDRNKPEILLFSGDIAHYIGDAHVPLHTSENHDGQLTGQKGIHSMWESEMPEKFAASYTFFTGQAKYIDKPQEEIWKVIENSSRLAAIVLKTEKQLSNSYPAENKFLKDAKGDTVKNRFRQSKHSADYLEKYNRLLKTMIQDQLTASVKMVGDLWYTAWVNAGRPDLTSLDDSGLTLRNKPFYQADYSLWKKGKLVGLRAVPEF